MNNEWRIVTDEHREQILKELKPYFINSLSAVKANYTLGDLLDGLVLEGGISLVYHLKSKSGVIIYDDGKSGLELVIGAYRGGIDIDAVGALLKSLQPLYNIVTYGRKGWKKVGDKFGFTCELIHNNTYKYTLQKEKELCL